MELLHVAANFGTIIKQSLDFPWNLFDLGGALLWKAESQIVDAGMDIPRAVRWPLQLLVANAPSTPAQVARVHEMQNGSEKTMYLLECYGRRFQCPALPYYISFDASRRHYSTYPRSIVDPQALAAYVDLLQSAAFAVPTGSEDYSQPLATSLWNEALLGGRYLIGMSTTETPVLVSLVTRGGLHEVSKCWIASETEYQAFLAKRDAFKAALGRYYDVYVR